MMRITGARLAQTATRASPLDLLIEEGHISRIAPAGASPHPGARAIDLSGYLILPGLINAHDHLEFNLFPRLGRGPYPNAEAWAASIYRPNESPVRQHRQVPRRDRLLWGALKNLLSGVTTVCHHNPYEPEVFDDDFPIRVVKDFGWAHSLAFDDNIPAAFRATPPEHPFILHLGEGTDQRSRHEIFYLDRMGCLDERTVLVHGVAIDSKGRTLIRKRGASLIWCPSSNLHSLGMTLDSPALRLPVALGTDSAVTAEGDLLDEIRVAKQTAGLPDSRLYEMVTTKAAELLRLKDGRGRIAEGAPADLIAIHDSGGRPAEALCSGDPPELHLVMVEGEVRMVAQPLAERMPSALTAGLQPISIEGRGDHRVAADTSRLVQSSLQALGEIELALAHKRVAI